MQQAFTEKEIDGQEPAAAHLRIVHSSRITEHQKAHGQEEEPGKPAGNQPVVRHDTRTHYGRSYYPDGPAGSYQGL